MAEEVDEMVWRTGRGLIEPSAATVIWMSATLAGAECAAAPAGARGTETGRFPSSLGVEPDALRLAERAGEGLFDPIEFARVGGWAPIMSRTRSWATH